jgi:hypothetical protein
MNRSPERPTWPFTGSPTNDRVGWIPGNREFFLSGVRTNL